MSFDGFDDFDPELHGIDFNEEAALLASVHIEEMSMEENRKNYESMSKSSNYRKIVFNIFGLFDYKSLLQDMMSFFEKKEEYEKCAVILSWMNETKIFENIL